VTPPEANIRRSSVHASKIDDGVPHSSFKEKSEDVGDLKERLMVDIFSKIR
jgi:hypothetical protein